MNYNEELRKFRNKEENKDLSFNESRTKFKEVWKEMKDDDFKEVDEKEDITEVDEKEDITEVDEAIDFYNKNIKGRTAFNVKTIDKFKKHFRVIVGHEMNSDVNCSSCLSRSIKIFKKKLNLK